MIKFTSFIKSGDPQDAALIDFLEANQKSDEIALLGALWAAQKPNNGYPSPQPIWPSFLKKYFQLIAAEFDVLEAIGDQEVPITRDQLVKVAEIESRLPDDQFIRDLANALFSYSDPKINMVKLQENAFPGGYSAMVQTSYGRKIFQSQFDSIIRHL